MNIDEAINKAADHIEQYPESYHFGQGMVIDRKYQGFGPDPGPGGPHACMLARIGEMAGVPVGVGCDTVARYILSSSAGDFYEAIRAATGSKAGRHDPVHHAPTIPAAMRKVAKKYEGIPIGVRQIFDAPPSETLAPHYRVFSVRITA
jgi:hypothetical protein